MEAGAAAAHVALMRLVSHSSSTLNVTLKRRYTRNHTAAEPPSDTHGHAGSAGVLNCTAHCSPPVTFVKRAHVASGASASPGDHESGLQPTAVPWTMRRHDTGMARVR